MPKKKKRRPLLQRAALHALKTLVTEHPRVALSVAGAGAGYAVKSVAKDAREIATDAAEQVKQAVTPKKRNAPKMDRRAGKDWGATLSKRERAALRDFARRHGSNL